MIKWSFDLFPDKEWMAIIQIDEQSNLTNGCAVYVLHMKVQ